MNDTDVYALGAIIILAIVSLYLRFGPKRVKERIKFELTTLLGLVTGILLIYWNAHKVMEGTVDSALWEVVAGVQCFAFTIIYLLVAFLVRWAVYSKFGKERTEP